MHQAPPGQPKHEIPRGGAGYELGRPLDQAAVAHESLQALLEAGAGVSLGVREDRLEPSCGEPLDTLLEAACKRPGGRLQQHPPAGAAERHHPQLGVGEAVGLGLSQLPAWADAKVDPLLVQVYLQRVHALGDFLDAHFVIVPDVWRRAYDRDPVLARLARHRQTVVEVACAVVERRQDMAVQVDHGEEPGVPVCKV